MVTLLEIKLGFRLNGTIIDMNVTKVDDLILDRVWIGLFPPIRIQANFTVNPRLVGQYNLDGMLKFPMGSDIHIYGDGHFK